MKLFLQAGPSRALGIKALAGAIVLGNIYGGTAQADVSWEHTGQVTIGKGNPNQVMTFGMKNAWSGRKHAMTVSYDATKVMGEAASMAPGMTDSPMGALASNAAAGDFTLIHRFDDDKALMVTSASKQYMEEPLSTLPSRLRLNVWEGLDAKLDNNPPALTDAQRERMGREIKAVVAPFARKMSRYYFRPMPNQRIIDGMATRGYRMTAMVNTSFAKGGQEWTRMAAEWWLADALPGDEQVRALAQEAHKFQETSGGTTASMWANEMPHIMMQAMPDEFLDAWATMVGQKGTPKYGFQGTPVQMFMTLSPPAATRLSMGDVRISMELKQRSTEAVDAALFTAPEGFKQVPLEPLLKLASNAIKQMKNEITKELGQ